jgi:hypothetical protein
MTVAAQPEKSVSFIAVASAAEDKTPSALKLGWVKLPVTVQAHQVVENKKAFIFDHSFIPVLCRIPVTPAWRCVIAV